MSEASGSPFASARAPFAARIRQRRQPVQSRSQATVEAILDAAVQVLLRDGHARLTTSRVAERAGVSVGSLYQYYPDKRALVTALKARYFGAMLAAVAEAVARCADDAPAGATVREALRALLTVKREHLALSRALRPAFDDPAAEARPGDAAEPFAALLREKLLGRRGAPPDDAWRIGVLVAALEGAITHVVWTAPERLADDALLDGLCALADGFLRTG